MIRCIILFFGCIFGLHNFIIGQEYNLITEKFNSTSNTNFLKLPLFSTNKNNIVDGAELEYIKNYKPNFLSLQIISPDQHLFTLELFRNSIFTSKFEARCATGESLDHKNFITYQGRIKGKKNSLVTLTINDYLHLLYSCDGHSYEITHINGKYEHTRASKQQINYQCHIEDDHSRIDISNTAIRSVGNCLEVHITMEHDLYLLNGSSANALSYITSVFNNVAAVYALHGVSLVISGSTIFNVPDNFSNTNLQVLKNSFLEYRQANPYTGRITYLFSADALNGGISQGIGGYCNSLGQYPAPLALSASMTVPSIQYPTYSFNVYNVAHEIGHVMGLRHSHACVWNGNNTQVDDCGNVWADDTGNTIEGASCYDENAPILPSGSNGTIMSYCNLLQGSGINLAYGFGPIIGEALLSNYINAPCSLGNNCGSVPPGNDVCANAFPIELSNECRGKTVDNDNATASTGLPNFTCGTAGSAHDIWFKCTVPPSGSMTFETLNSPIADLTDLVVEAYSGSCGALTSIACDDNSGDGNHAKIVLSNRTPGEIIYFRVIESGSNDTGEFDVCAYDASLPCHPDFNALIELYNATGGDLWTNKNGWENGAQNIDCNVCTWYGVVCNTSERVKELNLGNNALKNVIPSDIIQLTSLQRLNLYGNSLLGALPTFLNQLPQLSYVDLGNNDYSGSIPPSFGQIVNLTTLYLDGNTLSGNLQASLVDAPLTNLWLNNNNFSGCIPHQYQNFCTNGTTVRLEGNASLPFGGNYTLFCQNGSGDDADGDGYCAFAPDCNDADPLTFPGAAEYCDGLDNDCDTLADEGVSIENITWTGSQSKLWSNPLNWNLSRLPQSCHNVFIPPAVEDSVIVSAGFAAKAYSVLLHNNAFLNIQNQGLLTLNEGGAFTNQGNLRITGRLRVTNPLSAVSTAVHNQNLITVTPNGTIDIQNFQITGIHNYSGAIIANEGIISLDGNNTSSGLNGILNFGTINNFGTISTQNITGRDIFNKINALLNNEDSGFLDLK